MAEKKGSSIRFDDFVGAVHADPAAAEPSLLLSGYIGRSDNAENLRVYPDAGLGHWFEVPQADVIHSMPQADSPLGGSHLWVRASAQITPGAPKPPAVEGGGETDGSEGSEGGAAGAQAGSDTGIFNPFATIQPTVHMGCWPTMGDTGCGPQTIHPTLLTQFGCWPTVHGCPPTAICGMGAEAGAAEGGGPAENITINTLPAVCFPSIVCPPQNTAATVCTRVSCPPTRTFICPINTAATACTQFCPRTRTFLCPVTTTFNCPPTRICPTRLANCPTQIGCVTRFKCPTQLGCPDTRVCTPGALPGGFGGQEADAQITLMTIDTLCTQVSPCVGHTGTQNCQQQGADTAIGQTGWHTCHLIGPTGWLGCQPPLGPTGWHGCGGGGGGGGEALQGGPVGQTGWFTCHLVGPTGTQGCHQPLGPTGTQGCGGGGGQFGNVGPTGWQGCHQIGHTGWQGCHQIGQTGWLGCHQPLGPTGTQGCGGGGQLGNVGPTGTQGCHPPIGPTGWQGCGVADTVRGPTAWLGCHQPVGPTGWQGCQPQNNVSVPGNCPTVGIACMPTIPCLPPSVGCPSPHTSMMGCPNTSTC